MSRSKDAFGRAYDFGEAPTGCPNWLDRFAQEQAAKEETLKKEAQSTIVEQSRNRGRRPAGPSIYDQMHAIMNGGRPARAGSVEAVVEQYQERTGLKDYMKRSAGDKIAQAAARIKAVAQPAAPAQEDPPKPMTDEDYARMSKKPSPEEQQSWIEELERREKSYDIPEGDPGEFGLSPEEEAEEEAYETQSKIKDLEQALSEEEEEEVRQTLKDPELEHFGSYWENFAHVNLSDLLQMNESELKDLIQKGHFLETKLEGAKVDQIEQVIDAAEAILAGEYDGWVGKGAESRSVNPEEWEKQLEGLPVASPSEAAPSEAAPFEEAPFEEGLEAWDGFSGKA